MTTAPDPADPATVLGQAMAFQPAKLVLTALDVGLFALLADRPAGAAEVGERLGLHPRGTRDFLDALSELGVLVEESGTYRNSPAAQAVLVPGDDRFQGGFLAAADRVMYPAWGRLAEALRTGQPQAGTFRGPDMFTQLYDDPAEQEAFVRMAEDASRPLIPALVAAFDWAAHGSVLELGGCRGNVLAAVVRAHPHLAATVFDLPQLEPAFGEHVARLGLAGRLGFAGGDFFADPLPAADVVMIGHALVDWDDDQRRELIRSAYAAVRPGGAFLIWDPMVVPGESRLRNLVRSLNLQLMTPTGSAYRLEDCVGWLQAAGFTTVAPVPLGHDVTLLVAHKN
jgi:SAM-dependent methyltransferase